MSTTTSQLSRSQLSQRIFDYEDSRKLPVEALEFMYDENRFKLFVPAENGGANSSLPEAISSLIDTAQLDGNLGWVQSTGAGASIFYGYMQPEIAKAVFTDPNSVIAGSGAPMGTARKVEGGYRVSGTWPYGSGSDFATSFTFNCKVDNDSSHVVAVILDPDQVNNLKDWSGFGLKATSTHTLVVDEAFVAEDRTFDLSRSPFRSEAIYQLPFLPFAQMSIVAVGVGIARAFLRESERLIQQRLQKDDGKQVFWESVQQVHQKVAGHHRDQQRSWEQKIQKNWESFAKDTDRKEIWEPLGRSSQQLSRENLRIGQDLVPLLGMTAIKETSYINYLWRNLQTACQHALIVPVPID